MSYTSRGARALSAVTSRMPIADMDAIAPVAQRPAGTVIAVIDGQALMRQTDGRITRVAL